MLILFRQSRSFDEVALGLFGLHWVSQVHKDLISALGICISSSGHNELTGILGMEMLLGVENVHWIIVRIADSDGSINHRGAESPGEVLTLFNSEGVTGGLTTALKCWLAVAVDKLLRVALPVSVLAWGYFT